MKRKVTFILSIILALCCKPNSRLDLIPFFLLGIGANQTESDQSSFQILFPKEGEIITVYQLEATIQTDISGEFEIYDEEQKLFPFRSIPPLLKHSLLSNPKTERIRSKFVLKNRTERFFKKK